MGNFFVKIAHLRILRKMKEEIDDITKKTLFEFKKFARENGFWEEYKKLSRPLRCGESFISLVKRTEPVKLIQNSEAFCQWPTEYPQSNPVKPWRRLSREWAHLCLANGIYRNWAFALRYARMNISNFFYSSSLLEKKYNNIS